MTRLSWQARQLSMAVTGSWVVFLRMGTMRGSAAAQDWLLLIPSPARVSAPGLLDTG